MKSNLARYAICGLGYSVWSPGNKGLPEYWFGSLREVREFAAEMGWQLKGN